MIRSLLLASLLSLSGLALGQASPAAQANPNQPVDPTAPNNSTAANPGTMTTTPGYAGASFGSGTADPGSSAASMPRRADGPIRISGGVMQGNLLTRVDPVYPADARANGVQGTVVLAATIGRDGTVQKLSVVSGPSALAAAATTAVKQWTYKPYLLNGKPVDVSTVIHVNFNLPAQTQP